MTLPHAGWGVICALLLSACGGGDGAGDREAPGGQDAAPPLSSSSPSSSPYGRWAAQPAWCESSGQGAAIVIAPGRFEGRENHCEMEETREGEGEWTAVLRCQGEGMTSRERIRLGVEGDVMTLTYLDRDGAAVALGRCS